MAKISELLAQAGLTEDDLIDDEFDLPVKEVRKRLKANQEGYTKATQAVAERDRDLQAYAENIGKWETYTKGLEGQVKGLEQRIAERAERVQAAGGDWRRDPLFNELISDFDTVVQGVQEAQNQTTALAKGMFAIADRYNNDRKAIYGFVDRVEQRFLKQDHPDFDAEEVRKWSQQNGVSDSWENSYKRMRADRLPQTEEEIKKKVREEVIAEHGDKLREPPATEMGGGGARATLPAGHGVKKEYKDSWGGLVHEFQRIGQGSS
jgi:hemoglobin-like flavoprotein